LHNLKKIRLEQKLTQTELGRKIHISPSAISAVEAGDRRPWPNFRKKVARALGVAEAELFGDE